MNSQSDYIFGDQNTFAIRYNSDCLDKSKRNHYEYCHLVLGGQIIGDLQESCYLESWTNSIKNLKNRLLNNFVLISNSEFKNRNDKEIVELITKANQVQEDYKSDFYYLPILENSVWDNCHFNIDETTDAYILYMIESNGRIKFLWEGWREPCPKDRIDKLFSIVVDREFVVDSITKFLRKIESDRLNYQIEK